MKQFHKLEIIDKSGERQSLSIITDMAIRWKILGTQLGFTPQKLNTYGEDYSRVEERCASMLEDWIRHGKNCRWSCFLKVLEDMNERELLEKLEAVFFS